MGSVQVGSWGDAGEEPQKKKMVKNKGGLEA